MIKKLIPLLALITLAGCDEPLYYEGSTRVVFEGIVTDAEGNPAQNIPVGILVQKDSQAGWFLWPGSSGGEDYISYTTTDANGHYLMVFPRPANEDEITVAINTDIEGNPTGANTQYGRMAIRNILKDDLANYGIDFGSHSLYSTDAPTTTLTIAFEDVQQLGQVPLSLFYTAIMPDAQVFYNTTDFPDDYYDYNPYPFEGLEITVAQNQEVALDYNFTIGLDTIQQHLVVPVGTAPLTYTIQY